MTEPLSRQRVVDAALHVVREHGLDGLSMRKVAAELDVEAMSLYTHVRNKADLLDALHDEVLARVPHARPGPWRPESARVARAFRDVLFAEHATVPLLATRPATSPAALALADSAISLLVEAGFSDDQAFFAFQTVFAFVIGHAVFHTAGGALPDDDDAREEFEAGLELLLTGIAVRFGSG